MMTRIKRNRFMLYVVIVAISAFVSSSMVGCSWISSITGSEDPVKNSYSGLYGTGSIYGMALASIRMLQDQGIVSAAQRDIANKAAAIFRATYYSTVDYLVMWKLGEGTVNESELQTNLQNALIALTGNWQAFQDAINALSPGLIQGKIEIAKSKSVVLHSEKNLRKKGATPKSLDPTLVPIIISVIGLLVQYALPQAMTIF